ncbi:MAG: protein translocase subunit SecF [bacterium]
MAEKEAKKPFDYIGHTWLWFTISAVLLCIGIGALVYNGMNRGSVMNFGIDFTGGTIITVRYQELPSLDQVREKMGNYKLQKAELQIVGDNDLSIRTEPLEETQREKIVSDVLSLGKGGELLGSDMIGPVIGDELRIQAFWALIIASVLMTVYITFRFRFDYAIAAILALFHDAIITTGIIALLWRSIDASFIAAILTILGYSINDTIVIFDRVRENLAKPGAGKKPLKDVLNESIRQTMARSINTVLVVLFMNAAVLIFGGATLKDFATTLLIGFTLGAYSSIFVASPLLAIWHKGK